MNEARAAGGQEWRKPNPTPNNGLEITSKDKNEKDRNGKQTSFPRAMADDKGVIGCEQYEERSTGNLFPKFVKNQFPIMFEKGNNTKGKLFLKMGSKVKLKGGP